MTHAIYCMPHDMQSLLYYAIQHYYTISLCYTKLYATLYHTDIASVTDTGTGTDAWHRWQY